MSNFVKYHSIINHYKGDEIDYIKLTCGEELRSTAWIVSEKIHGANFSVWIDEQGAIRPAKRSGFCDRDFYSCGYVLDKYNTAFAALFQILNKRPIVVYGEMFGGAYEGEQSSPHTKKIQKEVQYCPHNDFAVFDIAYVNGDKLDFLPEWECIKFSKLAGLLLAPQISVCNTLETALSENEKFITTIPTKFYGLQDLPNNWAEGLVIKPAKPIFLPDGKRVLFKKKNELFKEGGEVVTDSCVTDEFAKFNTRLATCFTVNRFNNVVSHYGTNERMEFYFDMFIQDAIDEVDREVYNNFTDSQKKLLRKLSAKYIWPIIKLELKR